MSNNQKTPEDIEKIKKWDSLESLGFTNIEDINEMYKENQQLKEDLKLIQEAFRECSQSEMSCRVSLPLARKKIDELYAELDKLKQNSKTNADIVEKFGGYGNLTKLLKEKLKETKHV